MGEKVKRGPKPKDYGVCAVCGKPLNKDQGKYCSRACMWESQRKIRAEASEAKRRRVCETCGKTFIMHWQSGKANRGEVKEGRFCSNKCKWEAQRKPVESRLIEKRTWHCKICGKEMSTYGVYCSDECRKGNARRKARASNSAKKQLKERPCKECGKMFVPEYGNKRRKYCSDICLHRSMKRQRRQKERARMRNVKVETVNAMRVFKRDGWYCQLCGKKLNPKHKGTIKDNAPELDHIIPLSKGGEHSYRNTQCACRRCNREKGARELGQLRLFG